MKVRDRVKKLAVIYKDRLKVGDYDDFCAEVESILKDRGFDSAQNQIRKPPPQINNPKRFRFIREIQKIAFEGFLNVPYWMSGYIADTFIVVLRSKIKTDEFQDFSRELFDICNKSKDEDKSFKKSPGLNLITDEM